MSEPLASRCARCGAQRRYHQPHFSCMGGRCEGFVDPARTFTTEMIARVVAELPNPRIRPWRSPTGEEFYIWNRRTGTPIDGPTFMIDQAIASAQARRTA